MRWTWTLATGTTVLLAAASGGAFLVWSTFVPAALARLPAADAMAAMQQANVTAPRSPLFMALLFAPGLLGTALAVRAVAGRAEGSTWVVAGAAVYLVGVVGTTIVFHVPRNEALAALDAATDHGAWSSWLSAWVAGNHVRTVSGLLAAALLGRSMI